MYATAIPTPMYNSAISRNLLGPDLSRHGTVVLHRQGSTVPIYYSVVHSYTHMSLVTATVPLLEMVRLLLATVRPLLATVHPLLATFRTNIK